MAGRVSWTDALTQAAETAALAMGSTLPPGLVEPPVCFSISKAAGTRLPGSSTPGAHWPVPCSTAQWRQTPAPTLSSFFPPRKAQGVDGRATLSESQIDRILGWDLGRLAWTWGADLGGGRRPLQRPRRPRRAECQKACRFRAGSVWRQLQDQVIIAGETLLCWLFYTDQQHNNTEGEGESQGGWQGMSRQGQQPGRAIGHRQRAGPTQKIRHVCEVVFVNSSRCPRCRWRVRMQHYWPAQHLDGR